MGTSPGVLINKFWPSEYVDDNRTHVFPGLFRSITRLGGRTRFADSDSRNSDRDLIQLIYPGRNESDLMDSRFGHCIRNNLVP